MSDKKYSTTWYEHGHGAGEIAKQMGLNEHIIFWAEVACECDKGKGTEDAIASAAEIIEKDGGLVPDDRNEPSTVELFRKLMLNRSRWRQSEAGRRWHERADEIIAKMAQIPVE